MTLHAASSLLGHDIDIHVDNDGLRAFFGMVLATAKVGTAPHRCGAPRADPER